MNKLYSVPFLPPSAQTAAAPKANQIDFAAITKAYWAAGPNEGLVYNLFKTSAAATPGASAKYYYNLPVTASDSDIRVLKGKNFVEAPKNTDMLLFGFQKSELDDALKATPSQKYYITSWHWTNIWDVAKNYYDEDGTAKTGANDPTKVTDATIKATLEVFTTYKNLIDFTLKSAAGTDTPNWNPRAYEIDEVNFKLVNKEDAKYFTAEVDATADAETGLTLNATKAKLGAVASGYKKVVPMEMIITDIWGKVMTYEFEVEISL